MCMLFEEFGVDYEVYVFDLIMGQYKMLEFFVMNLLGKVLMLCYGDVVVIEQVVVYFYVVELYLEVGLLFVVGDLLCGVYLCWMVFYGLCFELVVVDYLMGCLFVVYLILFYGDFDMVIVVINVQLVKGLYFFGECFMVVDVFWGVVLDWIMMFKLMFEMFVVCVYIDCVLVWFGVKCVWVVDFVLVEEQDQVKVVVGVVVFQV